MNILTVVKEAKSISELLSTSQVEGIIGDIGVEAAERCLSDFRQIKNSSEKKDLIKSAINHLEMAEIAFEQAVKNTLKQLTRPELVTKIQAKRQIALCTIMLCEKYLGNDERVEICYSRLITTDRNPVQGLSGKFLDSPTPLAPLSIFADIGLGLIAMVNPLSYYDMYNKPQKMMDFDSILDFKKNLASKKI